MIRRWFRWLVWGVRRWFVCVEVGLVFVVVWFAPPVGLAGGAVLWLVWVVGLFVGWVWGCCGEFVEEVL
jgi:hypothetical protein